MNLLKEIILTLKMFFFFRRELRVLLGRWYLTGKKMNNIKIDWANTDNCGISTYK
jgi:hypothetical protein